MNAPQCVLSLVASVLTASCAYVPMDPQTEHCVSPDYAASGPLHNVQAYVYGNHTVVALDRISPALLSVRDADGNPVSFEHMGRLYRLDRKLDTFTLWRNGRSATFSAVARTQVFTSQPDDPVRAPHAPAQATLDHATLMPDP